MSASEGERTLEPLVTVKEAASFLGVKPGTVYLWAEAGRIPSFKIGAVRRFRISDLEAHLRAHRDGADLGPPGERSVVDGIMPDIEV